jgi:protein-L-isoaspartate(D-aspartate) O-methyltransferase
VSKASEDLPEPETPVSTTSFFLGMRTSTERRLCSRAPWMAMWSSSAGGMEGRQDSRGRAPAYHARMPLPARARLAACLLLAVAWAAPARAAEPAPSADDARAAERERMVAEQIEARGVSDPRLLAALRAVPRHAFVPAERAAEAYADRAVPIGHGATISQPYVVAVMTEQAAVREGARVLEVGTGSGYQAALLAALGAEVYTIEIVEPLARRAEASLRAAGHPGVHVRAGDGYRGWPEAAPFDAVLVTAAAPRVPQPLLDQLARAAAW